MTHFLTHSVELVKSVRVVPAIHVGRIHLLKNKYERYYGRTRECAQQL